MRHVPVSELQANAAELTAAIDAGEEVVITLEGREYKLVAAHPVLTPERRLAMEEAAAFRRHLREQGVRVTPDEISDWIKGSRR